MSVHEHDIEEQTAITLKINMAFFHWFTFHLPTVN